jgi:tRNA threonylcarbamoyl adenosine modification protein YeaZ
MELFIETSSFFSSVALFHDGNLLQEVSTTEQNSHSEKLHLLIRELLQTQNIKAAQLHTLVMGGGPGSNTGLRIGLAALKGLSLVSGGSILAIDTHAAMCYEASGGEGNCLIITTSKKGLYNYTLFEGTQIIRRDNNKNLEALSQTIDKQIMVVCPDDASINTFKFWQPKQCSPKASKLGTYFYSGKKVQQIELQAMY